MNRDGQSGSVLRSMTAYGRAQLEHSLGRFTAELHSVNRRFLEIRTSVPRGLLRYDPQVREWVSARLGRGQVSVSISVSLKDESPLQVSTNVALARQYADAYRAVAGNDAQPPWTWILEQEGVMVSEERSEMVDAFGQPLKEVVEAAIEQLQQMKAREGAALQRDLLERADNLETMLKEISKLSEDSVQDYRQKLRDRIADYGGAGEPEQDERLVKEIAIYADKVDVSEEIIRFQSHIDQLRELLSGSEEVVGRALEFLVQELQREATTMGSKTNLPEVGRLVVETKGEIERIREQIQNVE